MKKIITLLVVAVALAGIGGYILVDSTFNLNAKSKISKEASITNAGGSVSRQMKVSSFDKIEVEGCFKVEFSQGPQTPLSITGPSLEMEHMKVSVKGSTLEIEFDKAYYDLKKNKRNKADRLVTVNISAPSLRSIEMSLSSSFTANTIRQNGEFEIEADTSASVDIRSLQCDELDVDADTSGSVNLMSVTATKVNADADTSGSIRLNATAATAILKADTSGSVKVNTLTVATLTAKADTSGSVQVETLTADNVIGRADTSGKVTLKGKAGNVDFRADTSGYIKAGDLSATTATVGSDTGGKVVYNAKSTRTTNSSLVNTYKAN